MLILLVNHIKRYVHWLLLLFDHECHLLLLIVFSVLLRSVISLISSWKNVQHVLSSNWTLTPLPPSVKIPYPLVMEFQILFIFVCLMIYLL